MEIIQYIQVTLIMVTSINLVIPQNAKKKISGSFQGFNELCNLLHLVFGYCIFE